MEHTQELDKALNELKRITGITMDVSAETPEETELALTQIRCLCTAYKEKYNKTDFLQSLISPRGLPGCISHRMRNGSFFFWKRVSLMKR